MRRIKAIDGDIFRPRGQSARELELARERPKDVLNSLGPRLSDARRERIEQVVANRVSRLAVAVEGVHDPHNTAAIIRSADAFGVLNAHIVEGEVRFKSSRKVTQGSHKWVDVAVWRNLENFSARMAQEGRRILVADMQGSIPVGELAPIDEPTVLVFGNEAEGISQGMRELSHGAFRVPMFGFVESFNVSVAAAITLSTLRAKGGGDLTASDKNVLKARYYLRAVRAGYDIVMRGLEQSD